MLIRKQQLVAIQARIDGEFVARVLPLLRAEMAESCAAFRDPDLEAVLRRGVREAAALDITSETNVYRFVRVVVALGPTHADTPLPMWIAASAGGNDDEDRRTDALCARASKLFAVEGDPT